MSIDTYVEGQGNEDQNITISNLSITGAAGTMINENFKKLADRSPKSKYDATTAPTVNDDVDSDYMVGSRWIDVTGDKAYICVDNTSGAAVWLDATVTDVSYGQIPLVMCGVISTSTDHFKDITGSTFKYRLPVDGTITGVVARQGTVDSGASQADVDVLVDSTTVLSSAITLSGTADTDVSGTLIADPVMSAGDTIEIDVIEGTNGDAEDLFVEIVFYTGA